MIFVPQCFRCDYRPTIAADYKKVVLLKSDNSFSLLGINFLLMTALLTAYLFFSTEIISTTVGEEYLAGSQIINIFVLAFYFSSIFGPVGSYLNLTGGARFLSVITLISIVVIFSNLEHSFIPLEAQNVYLLVASVQFRLFLLWLRRMYSIPS